MKNSRGVSLIALIITIIVIIILAAIVMNASTSTVGNAQYARFAQEFGEFTDQVALDAANVKSNTGIRGQIINDAQMFYMTANGFTTVNASGEGVHGFTIPVGYVLTNRNTNDTAEQKYQYVLQYILNVGGASGDGEFIGDKGDKQVDSVVAYVINDGVITNYSQYGDNLANGSASHEFYGDSNGEEYHFVTSNGQIFTLPGYPVQQSDGSIEYHIDSKNGHYYVVAGNSGLSIGDKNVNGNTVTNKQPILAKYLSEISGKVAETGDTVGTVATGLPSVVTVKTGEVAEKSQKIS
ncbi:MAG: hypothetical protein IKR04_03025 [Clostridia bacterium]|nr:hypothetical protein [Clostridia bacterium]